MKPVKLNDIVEHLDSFFMDGWNVYYNKKTGQFTEVQVELLGIVEEFDEEDDLSRYAEWEWEAIQEAIDIIDNWDDYIELPDKYEINEYGIMEEFCESIDDAGLSNKFCNAISGRGAFRRFKDLIIRYGLADSWYAYKRKSLSQIAREWCEDNNITYVDK